MANRESIRATLKHVIVQALRLEDVNADDLRDDQALADGDIAIDSIDILQIILEIEKTFGIRLVRGEYMKRDWETLDTLAAAIERAIEAQQPMSTPEA